MRLEKACVKRFFGVGGMIWRWQKNTKKIWF